MGRKEDLRRRGRDVIKMEFSSSFYSVKLNLEEAEQDRDSLRYKLSEKKRELDKLNEQVRREREGERGREREGGREGGREGRREEGRERDGWKGGRDLFVVYVLGY